MRIKKTTIQKRGVVILFAVLLVSVVLTISLGVFNIAYRQLVLSSIARESEFAFFAADSARNCAYYWDSPFRDEATARPFGYYDYNSGIWSREDATTDTLSCGGVNNIPVSEISPPPDYANYYVRQFTLVFDLSDRDACAVVTVKKNNDVASRETIITADGYNSGTAANCPPTAINRAVQRTIETTVAG